MNRVLTRAVQVALRAPADAPLRFAAWKLIELWREEGGLL